MVNYLLIFLGSGLGGLFRYCISTNTYLLVGRQFPYGTLLVNASGCFIMGLLFVIVVERISGFGPELRALLLVGFLGGYTTFSAFSIETVNLFENCDWLLAILNILISVTVCILLTWLGILGGRHL